MNRKTRLLTIILLTIFSLVACTNGEAKSTYNSSNANEVHIGLVYPVEMIGEEIQLSRAWILQLKK